MTIKIPRVIHDEFIYEHNGLPDDDYRSKMKALGEELHEELEEHLRCVKGPTVTHTSGPTGNLHNLPPVEPRVVRGVSPTYRYPQLQQIPRGVDMGRVMRFQTAAYGVAELKLMANLSVNPDELLAKWRKAFRQLAQKGYLILEEDRMRGGRPLNLSDLETYLTDNQQEPVKQKPFWMQLQDNQQKRQRGGWGKTKRSK